jgi:hypothetical protein
LIDWFLIKFTYCSTLSRLIIVLMIMIHSSQSSNFWRITFVFCDAAELMKKDIFDIVLIRKFIEQQRNNEAKKMRQWFNQSIRDFKKSKDQVLVELITVEFLLTDERMNC